MGFSFAAKQCDAAFQPLHERYRDDFPVTSRLTYLNHAAVAPLCRPAAEAMKQLADDALNYGSLHYDQWMAAYQGLRDAAARLINASPGEIAIVKNTSEGVATVALGLDWKPGDRIVVFREEFPANYFPWLRLEGKGVQITTLSIYDPLDRIAEAIPGARLLAISYVNYLSGYRVDLDAIDELYAPGAGMPNKKGLTYREIAAIAEYIGQKCNVVGIDVVEYNPLQDKDGKTAELAIELIATFFGKKYSWYTHYLAKNQL